METEYGKEGYGRWKDGRTPCVDLMQIVECVS